MKPPSTATVALLTGASSGIGEALAHQYAAAGWHLALAARSREPLERVAAELSKRYGIRTLAVVTDVAREADCRHFVHQAADHFGQIDLLINNAGISMRAPFSEVQLEVLERLMQVNFWGAVYCTQAALPWLIRSRGSIVGVSSIAGFRGLPYRTGYSASKFALQGFLESLRTELLPVGVHVLIACPGFTQSNIRQMALSADGSPQGESPRDESRMMTAEAVARHIYRAQQRRKRLLVLTTEGILTRWLNWLAPAWMDRMVWRSFEREQQRDR
jgi:short-subunit dehydrogenase